MSHDSNTEALDLARELTVSTDASSDALKKVANHLLQAGLVETASQPTGVRKDTFKYEPNT